MSLAVLALAGVGVACQPTKPPSPPAPPTQHCVLSTPDSAADYQAAFDGLRGAGTGWLASDGGLPAVLPDGRVLWMFGDTFVGSGPGDIAGLISNSLVVQDGNCFRPLFGPGGEALPDPQPGHWLWPTAAVVEGSNLRVFALHMEPAPGEFPFEYVRMDVATFALPGLTHVNTVEVPIETDDPLPSYGQTVVVANDGTDDFVYAYGKTTPAPLVANHFVARVPLGEVLTADSWEFWDDTTWSDSPAAPLLFDADDNLATSPTAGEGPVAPLAVTAVPGAYLGSALDVDAFGDQLETWNAPAPQGPFTFRALAVDIWPGPGGAPAGRIGYGGRVEFGILGGPIALWSVNQIGSAPLNLALYEVMFATPLAGSVP